MKEHLLKVLLAPVISEKATVVADLYDAKQFVFKVVNDATKPQIKSAIESLFKVKVSSVRVLNVKAKAKKHKGMVGYRKGWKKAYVSLMPGFDINFSSYE